MRRQIPNLCTLINLFCGSLSIVFSFSGALHIAAYLIGIAALFDFLDGLMARLLGAYSEFGKQLDSLADLVSFGLAPAVILYHLFLATPQIPTFSLGGMPVLAFIAFLVPLFSAMRLAKFNLDEQQTDSFIGLPTPANAILIASLPLILMQCAAIPKNFCLIFDLFLNHFYFLVLFTCFMCFMLVAEVRLFSLKFKDYSWNNNKWRYGFLTLSLCSLLIFYFIAIPLIIFFYILLSLIINISESNNRQKTSP